ncbi:MAG TPA: stress response translation initiation inhibitor YciH [Nitrososphaera sp.]|nr:stress response translation initiation inhibitor YciH [Nitrososphaera sp.]
MSSNFDNPMDELIEEIEKGQATLTITKELRKWKKPVTIISGLQDNPGAEDITRQLKTKIGTGGSFKEGQVILQGDHREKVKELLSKMGFEEDSIEVY